MKYEQIRFDEPEISRFELTYLGGEADLHRLDLYDASASFYGFARTLKIVGHFYSTGEINAHAPKSQVQVFLDTTEPGSVRQTIIAAAIGAVVATPLTIFLTRAIESWIPAPDPATQRIIELLEEQNSLLSQPSHSKALFEERSDRFIYEEAEKINVLRSITSNSFKDIFRPVGRSAETVVLSHAQSSKPIGAVNPRALALIEADRPDDDEVIVIGIVSSFSRGSKTGVMFSSDIGRGFKFVYKADGRLPPEDDFSWSQFYQRPIRAFGRFIRFFDGKIKKMIVYSVERVDEANDPM